MKIIIICAVFATALMGTCFWYLSRLQKQAAEEQRRKDADRKAKAWLFVNDTVVVSSVRNEQTGLTATFNKSGQIIDTFTAIPVFDSTLIKHSKIP